MLRSFIRRGLGVTCVLLISSSLAFARVWPAWMDVNSETESLGDLCESDKDLIGRKLGCDCKYPVREAGRNLFGDCSGQGLGTEQSRLPLELNVSRHVRRLSFSDNFLTELQKDSFGNVDGVTEADFARNRIQFVNLVGFPRLASFDLSHNLISNLTTDSFKNCPKIEVLDLSFNHLSFIDSETFSGLEYLRILNLGSNSIGIGMELLDEFPFQLMNLKRLEEIDLSNNTLREFPVSILEGSSHILKLDLKNNRILHIPPFACLYLENLRSLDLSGNYLNVLHPNSFHGLISLHILVLDGNKDLILIEEHAFAGLSSLKELSCQRNHRLTFIHPLAFKGDENGSGNDSNPSTVRFGDNALTSLDKELFSWKDLEYLDLIRNPFNCDCNLQWVAELKSTNPAEAAILIDPDFTCKTPAPLRSTPVASLDPGELMCYSNVAAKAGMIAIIITGLILFTFAIFFGLKVAGVLPDSFNKLNFLSRFNSLPTYMRVRPKSFNSYSEPAAPDLEWDNADIGNQRP